MGKAVFEWAPALRAEHVDGCRLYASRYELVAALVRPGTVGAEVGVQAGNFSEFILGLGPQRFYLIDINLGQIDYGKNVGVRAAVDSGLATLCGGRSTAGIKSLPRCDWIYVDASHTYADVREDLRLAAEKTDLIICNDYTQWDPILGEAYGVQKAVNELLLGGGWRMVGFGLHCAGFHDVALRRCPQ